MCVMGARVPLRASIRVSGLRWIVNSADGRLEQLCTLQQNAHMHTHKFTLPHTAVTLAWCNSNCEKPIKTSSAPQITYRHTDPIFQLSKHGVSQNYHNVLIFQLCPENTSRGFFSWADTFPLASRHLHQCAVVSLS